MLPAILLILIVIRLVAPLNPSALTLINYALVVVLVLCLAFGWGADWPRLNLGKP